MKKTSFIAIIIVFLAMSLKAQNPVLTLDSCFALAKANNAQLKTDQMEIQKAQEVKAQVFTKYFPQVSISYLAYYAAHPIVKYFCRNSSLHSTTLMGQGFISPPKST